MKQLSNMKNKQKKILIVEDDEFYGKLLLHKCTSEGYDVELVVNGKKAMESIEKAKPDLILLDLMMPVMDGFQTLIKLKSDSDTKELTVVILSNLGQDEDVKMVMDIGVDDYLIKADIEFSKVISLVKKHLK